MPSRAAISLSAAAISRAWPRLSSAHGPAISANGRSLPKRTAPAATTEFGEGVSSTFIQLVLSSVSDLILGFHRPHPDEEPCAAWRLEGWPYPLRPVAILRDAPFGAPQDEGLICEWPLVHPTP